MISSSASITFEPARQSFIRLGDWLALSNDVKLRLGIEDADKKATMKLQGKAALITGGSRGIWPGITLASYSVEEKDPLVVGFVGERITHVGRTETE